MSGYAQAHGSPAQQKASARGAAEHGSHDRVTTGGQAPAHRGDSAEPLNESAQAQSLLRTQRALDDAPRVQSQLALQRALNRRESRPAQAAPAEASPHPASAPVQKKPNATGLPDHLKAGVEQLSGLAMDDVRVQFNSPKPAAVHAHAYAQGSDIHLGPGQEKHLPHEAWHVVQQKQGRVKPTLQLKGVAINDDAALEREADVMARQAVATVHARDDSRSSATSPGDQGVEFSRPTEIDAPAHVFPGRERAGNVPRPTAVVGTAQRVIIYKGETYKDGAIPKNIHWVKGNDLEPLSKSPKTFDLGNNPQGVKALVQQALLEVKDEKVDTAKQEREKWIQPLLDMKEHIAGEIKNDEELKGGHLVKLMQETHKEKLNLLDKPADAAVSDCTWSLRKGGADSKEQFPAKKSTMFPGNWTWDDLKEELNGAQRVIGGPITLKSGIEIHSPGDTFYPKKSSASSAAPKSKKNK
jgi:hypothetical protein